jgi:hypothetical protein
MLIYGSRASHVKSVQLDQESCPHCGTQGSITLSTYARYAHVFWIPFFSVGRFSVSQCQHCKQALETKQMPSQIRAYHERNIAESKIPLWQFSGLAILLVAIAMGINASNADKEERAKFLENPQSGDVYEYKTGVGAYTTFRVVDVGPDSLAVSFNNYEVDKFSGLYTIDKEENYSDTTYMLTRSELMKMFASGDILDINRH